jgi:hypothetical protein
VVKVQAPSEFQLQQMQDILRARLVARHIDARCLDIGDPEVNLAGARQQITVKQGIEQPVAKKIVAAIKDAKLKVEAQINGDKLRVTGKKKRRPADRDRAVAQDRIRAAAAVRQFPRLNGSGKAGAARCARSCVRYNASPSSSPVRMRMTRSRS